MMLDRIILSSIVDFKSSDSTTFERDKEMTPSIFILTQPSGGYPLGTIVYECNKCDYGLASMDTRLTGHQHKSVTLKEDGDYPSFTVPLTHLAPYKQEPLQSRVDIPKSETPDFSVHYLIIKGSLGSGILKLFKDKATAEKYLDQNDVIDMSYGGATLTYADIDNAFSFDAVLVGKA